MSEEKMLGERGAEHTPGPWEVREVDGLFAIAHPAGWVLEDADASVNRADATLMAAAPALLAALRAYVEADEQRHRNHGWSGTARLLAARTAIAAATTLGDAFRGGVS